MQKTALMQGCQMLYINTNLGKEKIDIFSGHLEYIPAIWYILWLFCILYISLFGFVFGYLVYFMAIWYIFGYLVLFLAIRYIERLFGIFLAIWYILWLFGNLVEIWNSFHPFGTLCQEKSGSPALVPFLLPRILP
jgi:hypothetical protein